MHHDASLRLCIMMVKHRGKWLMHHCVDDAKCNIKKLKFPHFLTYMVNGQRTRDSHNKRTPPPSLPPSTHPFHHIPTLATFVAHSQD